MRDVTVTIEENNKINDKYFRLVFHSRELAEGVQPGQFVQVQIEPTQDPLLRRPFSYYRVQDDRIEILYEILGRGTGLLALKSPGSKLNILGPLGKWFTQETGGKKRILVAGGIGIPPLVFLAERCGADAVLIGAKSHREIMPPSELAHLKAEIQYATNDGSYGAKGYVTVLLEPWLKKHKPEELFIQTCGPKPMMRAVMDFALKHGIQGEASLDENMACGVGACLGCMVETHAGRVPSCVEGPVFPFECIKEIS